MKVLVISHNSISTYNAMGKTIRTFFSEFEKCEVCQFYIFPSYPDIDVCSSYYRTTDKDILNSYFKFRVSGGEVAKENICESSQRYENPKDENFYSNKKNKSAFRRLMRDLMWKCARWYNRDFDQWVQKENPDYIFLAPGDAKFIYDVALKIHFRYNIPLITYIADEYYFIEHEKGIVGYVQQKLLCRKIEKTMEETSHLITISKEFEEAYSTKFKVPTTTIMTGSNTEISDEIKVSDTVEYISYFGNIGYNRYVSLAQIGEALDEINAEKGTDIKLLIYSAQNDQEGIKEFQKISSVEFKGFISGEEFERTMNSAQLLIHTEAFDEKNIDLVKGSVSTKISDTLASGIPFFAYGPDSISSMKHLIRNDCAIIAISADQLKEKLETALFNKQERQRVAKNALDAAKNYHDKTKNSNTLRRIFESVNKENGV